MREPFYINKLQSEFQVRKSKNAQYSLRSFARMLNIHSSTLSAVLKQKRPFPMTHIDWVVKKLKFSDEETHHFFQSVIQERYLIEYPSESKKPSDDRTQILTEELHFDILSQWEYFAVLTLVEMKSFQPHAKYISQKLMIPNTRAEKIWSDLQKANLVEQDDKGKWQKKALRFSTTEDVSSQALRISHLEELEMGMRKLHQVPVLERDYSSVMLAIPPKNIMKAKKLIRQFRKDFTELIESDDAEQVYLMGIQLFPISTKN